MRLMKCRFLLLVTVIGLATAFGGQLKPGSGRFEFHQAGKSVPVWYFLPATATATTPLLFVMHGVKRDAEPYRKEWVPHTEKYGSIIVAPEVSSAEAPKDAD